MSTPHQRIQVLYEISLSIGAGSDLTETANTALSAYLQKLNCAAGAIIERRPTQDGRVSYEPVTTIPTRAAATKGVEAAFSWVQDETTADDSFRQSLPFTVEPADGVTAYVMDLPEFGILVLVVHGRAFDNDTLSALKPLNEKLATACKNERYEATVREERDRFEALFTTINEPLASVRLMDGQLLVQRCNPAFARTFGHDQEDTIGRPLSTLIGPAPTETDTLPAISEAETAVTTELRREKDDRMGKFLFRSAPINSTGENAEHLVLFVDVTEEAALKHREQQLQQQNEHLEQFASMVSHDLRNPLGIAETYTDFAEETGDPEDFDAIREALNRMDTMIDDMLAMARTGNDIESTKPVLLGDTAREAWEHIETEASHSLTAPTGYTVTANRDRLLHIFENLFRNSIEHSGEAVSVRVGMINSVNTTTRVSPFDQFSGFYVADDGPGIEEDAQADVFDAGYSTGGTGLGLAIVEQIVNAHDWTILACESRSGGARFNITGVEFVSN